MCGNRFPPTTTSNGTTPAVNRYARHLEGRTTRIATRRTKLTRVPGCSRRVAGQTTARFVDFCPTVYESYRRSHQQHQSSSQLTPGPIATIEQPITVEWSRHKPTTTVRSRLTRIVDEAFINGFRRVTIFMLKIFKIGCCRSWHVNYTQK